ncbi:MAG: hypothetical protein PHU03_07355, partial [Syntrophales bacterium]|nr:hypothetical protein [Syntrophales bacterium]
MTETEKKDPGSSKIRVGVVMGGISSEREISLESGRNIFGKLPKHRYEALPIFMDGRGGLWLIPLKHLMRNATADIEDDLKEEARRIPFEELKNFVDVVYIALHGKYGEDGCFQGVLELLNIPYVGSGVLASALGMNKYVSRRLLAQEGIGVPKTVRVTGKEWVHDPEAVIARIESEIGYPCVVKPTREGCSTAVSRVDRPDEVSGAVEAALQWDPDALVEEHIQGMEVTCGVIGNDQVMALTPSETIPTSNILSLEDKFLYGQGENKTPARLDPKTLERVKETARKTYK